MVKYRKQSAGCIVITIIHPESGRVIEATRKALKKRKEDLSIYILTTPGQLESSVLNDLKSFGKVLEIGDFDPTKNSVKFAQYYDPEKNFVWRALDTQEGGKNFLIAPAGDWHFALKAWSPKLVD